MNVAYLFLDLETTGLDRMIDEPWSMAYTLETAERKIIAERAMYLVHTAKPSEFTLQDREYRRVFVERIGQAMPIGVKYAMLLLLHDLFAIPEHKVYLVGANPSFDDAFMSRMRLVGEERWYDYHLIDIEAVALGYAGLGRVLAPPRLKDIAELIGLPKIDKTPHQAYADKELVRTFFWRIFESSKGSKNGS